MERSFANRGPTLQQLLQATAAERARKAAATTQVVGPLSQSSQSVAVVNNVAAQAIPQQVQVQAQQQEKQQAPQQAQKVQAQQKAAALQVNRFARRNVVDPSSKWAVHGKTIDEFNAVEAAAKAAVLQNAVVNNNLVKSSTGSVSSTSYFDIDSSLADVYKQASAAGISIQKPQSYGKSIVDAKKAQAIIDAYVATANKALASKNSSVNKTSVNTSSYYDIDSSLTAMYREAVAQGVKAAAPTTYGQSLKTEAAAKAAQQKYIDYLDQQYNAYNAAAVANAKATVYDDLGRQQTISQNQLAQMQKAASNQTWRENYTILPIEVANSNAEWWINSNGLYEWTPVTAGDKAELSRQNKQREQFHQAPKTTLTAGASPSDEYSKQWYSTGGNKTQVARNTKLAALKASSSVNNSASAKTNTAQQQKATVITAASAKKVQEEHQAAAKKVEKVVADVQKVAATIQAVQPVNWTSGFQSPILNVDKKTGELTIQAQVAKFSDIQPLKTISQLQEEAHNAEVSKKVNTAVDAAVAEARKINPNGSAEYFEGVANVARRSTMPTSAVLAEDWASANKKLSEKVTRPGVTAVKEVAGKVDAGLISALNNVSFSVNEKGQVAIEKKGKETLKNRTTFNVGKMYTAAENSVAVQGINRFVNNELEEIATKPLNYAAETGALILAGEALGAAYGGSKVLMKVGGAKLASKLASPTAQKFVEKASADVLDAIMVGTLAGSLASNEVQYRDSLKIKEMTAAEKKEASVQHAADYANLAKEFALGGIGFAKGSKVGSSAVSKALNTKVSLPSVGKLVSGKKGIDVTLESTPEGLVVKTYTPKSVLDSTAKKSAARIRATRNETKTVNSRSSTKLKNLTLEKNGDNEFVVKEYATKQQLKAAQTSVKKPLSNVFSDLKSLEKLRAKPALKPREITLEQNAAGELVSKEYASMKDIRATVKKNALLKKSKPNSNSKVKTQDVTLELTPEGDLVAKTYATKKALNRAKSTAKGRSKSTTVLKLPSLKGIKKKSITLELEPEGGLVAKEYATKAEISKASRKSSIASRSSKKKVKKTPEFDLREGLRISGSSSSAPRRPLTAIEKVTVARPRSAKSTLQQAKLAVKPKARTNKNTIQKGKISKYRESEAKEIQSVDLSTIIDPKTLNDIELRKLSNELGKMSQFDVKRSKKISSKKVPTKISANGRTFVERKLKSGEEFTVIKGEDLRLPDSVIVEKVLRSMAEPSKAPRTGERTYKTLNDLTKKHPKNNTSEGIELKSNNGMIQILKTEVKTAKKQKYRTKEDRPSVRTLKTNTEKKLNLKEEYRKKQSAAKTELLNINKFSGFNSGVVLKRPKLQQYSNQASRQPKELSKTRESILINAAAFQTGFGEIVKDFERIRFIPLPSAKQTVTAKPEQKTPSKINVKPIVRPAQKTPSKVDVKPIVKPSQKTFPGVKTPQIVDVKTIVGPSEIVPPAIKNTIIPVIKNDIIPDVLTVINLIPVITPVTKNDYFHRVDVSGTYISDPNVYKRRKITPTKDLRRTNRERVHLSREIKNRLGSLSSFFSSESSAPAKSRKKSIKAAGSKSAVVKPKITRKQTKRVKRA